MKQIGILGGTFDPIHNGHIELAKHAYNQFNLDEVWFMPAPDPPHKQDRQISPYEDRVNMVKLAISQFKYFVCSEYEKQRSGPSYTAVTLTELTELYPDYRFSFIVGADSFFELTTWFKPEVIMAHAKILVASRDYKRDDLTIENKAKEYVKQFNADIGIINSPELDISSNHIRDMYKSGKIPEKFLDKNVINYIHDKKLYI